MGNNSTDIRKIDSLGRVVLPKAVREELSLNEGDSIKVQCNDGKIIIEPFESTCLFCGGEKDLIEYKGKTVCRKCLKEAAKK